MLCQRLKNVVIFETVRIEFEKNPLSFYVRFETDVAMIFALDALSHRGGYPHRTDGTVLSWRRVYRGAGCNLFVTVLQPIRFSQHLLPESGRGGDGPEVEGAAYITQRHCPYNASGGGGRGHGIEQWRVVEGAAEACEGDGVRG